MSLSDASAQRLPCCCEEVHLTGREIDVLRLLAAGNTSLEAAGLLRLSKRTVDGHVAAMLRKAAVPGRMQLIGLAVAHGVIDMSVRPPRWTGRSCLPAPQVPAQAPTARDHGATQRV